MLLTAPLQTASSVPVEFAIALLALYGATLTAYIGTAAFFGWRLGRVPTRQEFNELRNELKADNTQLREELKADMAQLRSDFREDMAQLREDFRRSHQQLMLALVNHSHNEEGQAVFTAPPEMETTLSPADN